jgi:hypothetical protein
MTLQRTVVAAVAALALAACLALPARAEQPGKPAANNEPRVHRMEVWNGAVRTVHFFSQGYSPGEEAALRDLARAENELATADEVQSLRRLYLRNERILEGRRGQVNPLLYGYSSEYAAGLISGGFGGYGNGGFGGYGYGGFGGYPYGVGGFGNVAGTFGYGGGGALVGSASNSLSFGVGTEGVIKDVLAQGLGQATTPEAISRATHAYETAMTRVADSDRLRAGLGWGKGNVAAVGHERSLGGPVTLTLKDGKTMEGTLLREDAEWITIDTAKEEVSLRKSEVMRISRPKK